jgi:DNA helicase TIP49 (TBP-interacting protein)
MEEKHMKMTIGIRITKEKQIKDLQIWDPQINNPEIQSKNGLKGQIKRAVVDQDRKKRIKIEEKIAKELANKRVKNNSTLANRAIKTAKWVANSVKTWNRCNPNKSDSSLQRILQCISVILKKIHGVVMID